MNGATSARAPRADDHVGLGRDDQLERESHSPANRNLPEAAIGHPAVEAVLPDVAALYGTLDGTSFALLDNDRARELLHADPSESVATREKIALRTAGAGFAPRHVMVPLTDGFPVFTNPDELLVAVMLLAPQWCRGLRDQLKLPPKTLLAVSRGDARAVVARRHTEDGNCLADARGQGPQSRTTTF